MCLSNPRLRESNKLRRVRVGGGWQGRAREVSTSRKVKINDCSSGEKVRAQMAQGSTRSFAHDNAYSCCGSTPGAGFGTFLLRTGPGAGSTVDPAPLQLGLRWIRIQKDSDPQQLRQLTAF